jgi:putative hemolysin
MNWAKLDHPRADPAQRMFCRRRAGTRFGAKGPVAHACRARRARCASRAGAARKSHAPLSTVQIGITLIGILTGVYSGAVFAEHLAIVLRRVAWLEPYAGESAFAVIVVIVTYLSLIFGELVPKRVALAHAESLAEFVALPMKWVARIAYPLVWLLQVSTETVMRLLPMRSVPQVSITEDEVRSMIATGAKEGVFHRREKEMIESVLRLADRSVESVMVPRGDIVWLDANAPLAEVWAEARESGHARFLLCAGEPTRSSVAATAP